MTVHINFHGAGGHYSYLLGIASVLQTKYKLKHVIYSGYSAGCIPALLLCLGLNIKNEMVRINTPLLKNLESKRTKAFFNFLPELKKILISRFNEISNNIYKKANNKMHINLTYFKKLKNHVFNYFDSNQDLVECAMASGNLPLYNKTFLYKYKNKFYIDGGLSKMIKTDHLFHRNDYICLEIKTDMFRKLSTYMIYISTSIDYSNHLYNLGKDDALKNLKYFDNFLTRKK